MPSTEVTFTTTPEPRSRIAGTSARIIRIGPNTFVSNIFTSTSCGYDSIGPVSVMPALLTSTSTAPAAATQAATDSSLVTSSARRWATSRPSSASSRRAVATTS